MSATRTLTTPSPRRLALAGLLYAAEFGAFLALTPAAIFTSAVTLTYGAVEDLTQGAVAKLGDYVNRESVQA